LNNFETIYKDNYLKIYSLAVRLLGDKNTAKDITQDTFISFYDSIINKKEIKYPKTWLYRVASNKCFDSLKEQKRYESVQINESHLVYEKEKNNHSKKRKYIEKALMKLNAQNKLLVILYSEGFSYKNMAELTGIRFSSIGKTLSRTLKKLEQELNNIKDELY